MCLAGWANRNDNPIIRQALCGLFVREGDPISP